MFKYFIESFKRISSIKDIFLFLKSDIRGGKYYLIRKREFVKHKNNLAMILIKDKILIVPVQQKDWSQKFSNKLMLIYI